MVRKVREMNSVEDKKETLRFRLATYPIVWRNAESDTADFHHPGIANLVIDEVASLVEES